jgi:hypothetical protein
MAKKHTLNNLNCVPNALRNGSGAPGSNTLIFGSEFFLLQNVSIMLVRPLFVHVCALAISKPGVSQPLLADN